MRANERTDERVAQYFSLYSWLLSTIVFLPFFSLFFSLCLLCHSFLFTALSGSCLFFSCFFFFQRFLGSFNSRSFTLLPPWLHCPFSFLECFSLWTTFLLSPPFFHHPFKFLVRLGPLFILFSFLPFVVPSGVFFLFAIRSFFFSLLSFPLVTFPFLPFVIPGFFPSSFSSFLLSSLSSLSSF